MEKLIVAVGSTRRPKLEGLRAALAEITSRLAGQPIFEIAAVDVPSGVRHTPLSREELMRGARQRAEALARLAREKSEPWNYLVGLEGGVDVVEHGSERLVFLESWAYVADAGGRGAFGRSGGVLVPEPLARRVVDEGIELSEAIDAFAGGRGIRDAQGAWGILTRDLITREDAFRLAVISAFALFFNRAAYSGGASQAGA
ncbi:MAG TPA: inosine/xanthosine triphosphatase [Candidatus Sulfotelmatobacter sp.]|nr:inosine/xanthosine triphosphatase [Candidatus Sulfotelmatobacter sp.]